MEAVLLKVLWYIVHLLVDLFETFYYFGIEFRENFLNVIKNITKDQPSSTKESELQLIESSVQDLEKIPKHIIVILNINNEKDVDLSQLTNLIYWSMNSGVNFISFYDYKGKHFHAYNIIIFFLISLIFDLFSLLDLSSQTKYFSYVNAVSHMIITFYYY